MGSMHFIGRGSLSPQVISFRPFFFYPYHNNKYDLLFNIHDGCFVIVLANNMLYWLNMRKLFHKYYYTV